MINIKKIEEGHYFSELSHYKYTGNEKSEGIYEFIHLETNEKVNLGKAYIEKLLTSAEQFNEEINVGREDKFWTEKQVREGSTKGIFGSKAPLVGELRQEGIRSIWEKLHSQYIFTVSFNASSKESVKELKERRERAAKSIITKFGGPKVNSSKAELSLYIDSVLRRAFNNPVVREPRERILRGYKIQFTSRDGRYDCIDLDLESGQNIRPVNINTINWLLYNEVLYTVK